MQPSFKSTIDVTSHEKFEVPTMLRLVCRGICPEMGGIILNYEESCIYSHLNRVFALRGKSNFFSIEEPGFPPQCGHILLILFSTLPSLFVGSFSAATASHYSSSSSSSSTVRENVIFATIRFGARIWKVE